MISVSPKIFRGEVFIFFCEMEKKCNFVER